VYVANSVLSAYQANAEWSKFKLTGATEGTCGVNGDNVRWVFANGALYIFGTGAMVDAYNVTTMPWYSHLSSIKRAFLMEGVTNISGYSFLNCSNLTDVYLPSTLTGGWPHIPLAECPSLASITVDPNNPAYCSVDGVIFSKDMKTLFSYPTAKSAGGSYTIPPSVTTIGGSAFRPSKLASLTIPASVTTIGIEFLQRATQLTSITNLATTPQNLTTSPFSGLSDVYLATVKLIVPTSAVEAYRADPVWNKLKLPDAGQAVGFQLSTRVIPNGAWGSVGGTAPGVYAANTSATLTAAPAAGCMFTGWTNATGVSLGSDNTLSFKIVEDRVVTANFTTTHTLTFDSQGGGAVGAQKVVHNEKAVQPANPARTGYTFGGWYREAACSNAWSWDTAVTSSATLYAKWTQNTYAVEFNSQGGSAVSAQSIAHGGKASSPAAPARTGYAFGGWYREAACSSAWDFNAAVTSAATLYAKWTANAYAVKYLGNGSTGGSMANSQHAYGTAKELTLNTFTRTGYTFAGWALSATSAVAYGNAASVINLSATAGATVELHAQWTANAYTLSFHPNGGGYTYPTSKVVAYGAAVGAPASTSRVGYTLNGWYTLPSGGDKYDATTPYATAGDLMLYAQWTGEEYTLSFDGNGGDTSPSQPARYGSTVASLPTPARVGYTFSGWFTSPAGGAKLSAGDAYATAGNLTLYAQWTPRTYTLTFAAHGGDAPEFSEKEVAYGSAVGALPAISRAGHTLVGWYDGSSESAPRYEVSTPYATAGNLTLLARWTPNRYDVYFDSHGGSGVAPQRVIYGQLAQAPGAPNKTGGTFEGWYRESLCTTAWDFASDAVTEETTLYAGWSLQRRTVRFDSDGGSSVAPAEASYGALLAAPAAPTRMGYLFDRWYREASCTTAWDFDADRVTSDVTLYAGWRPTYTASFDAMGGSPVPPATVGSGSPIPQPVNPSRSGYTFVGWYADEAYLAPWSFSSSAYGLAWGNVTLYARWEEEGTLLHTVRFTAIGGSSTDAQVVSHGGRACAPPDPVRSGYTFAGWYADAPLSARWSFADSAVTRDEMLHAAWLAKVYYPVAFETEGGSAVDTQQVEAGGLVEKPANPMRSGYIFAGWYQNSGHTIPWIFSSHRVASGGVKIYARWLEASETLYTVTFATYGGSSVDRQVVVQNDVVREPAAPVRAGYAFEDWYADDDLTQLWSFTTFVTRHLTLHAKWRRATATVSFASRGGSAVSPRTVLLGDTLARPGNPVKVGATFGGWYSDTLFAQPWSFPSMPVARDTTLYARWFAANRPVFTVSFAANGGGLIDPLVVDSGSLAAQPPTPTRTGYTFTGWYADPSTAAARWRFPADTVRENLTLYAGWEVKSYAVIFETGSEGTPVPEQRVAHGGKISRPGNPTRPGYTFGGWYAEPESKTFWSFALDGVSGVTTLYAQWISANTPLYTVFFATGGGGSSTVEPQLVGRGDLVATPATPTRLGYLFGGWYADEALRTPWRFATETVQREMTLYARWWSSDAQSSLLILNPGGGTVSPLTHAASYGREVGALPTPARTGYSFAGWFDGGGTPYESTTLYEHEGNTTLTASWTVNHYAVRFNARGGGGVAEQPVAYGDTARTPARPGRTGYRFDGWLRDTTPNSPKLWSFEKDKITRDTTLYAKWTAETYALRYVSSIGGASNPNPAAYTVEDNITLQAAAKAGYTFAGWYDAEAGGNAVTSIPKNSATGDKTLYARWTPITYTLIFDGQEGNAPTPASRDYPYGDTLRTLAATSRTGYRFVGWYTGMGGAGKRYDERSVYDTVPPSGTSVTLYACFSVNHYAVAFSSNGGSPVDTQRVAYGAAAVAPQPAPTKDGYTFDGWYQNSTLSGDAWSFATTIAQPLTLHAKWTPVNYAIAYHDAGGATHANPPTYTVEAEVELRAAAKAGYTFAGWYTQSTGGRQLTYLPAGSTGNQELWARWQPLAYTIGFDAAGGTVGRPFQAATFSTEVDSLPLPLRTGFVFDGWYTQPDGGVAYTESTVYGAESSITLYARWKIATYTVTFADNGADAPVPPQTDVAYGGVAQRPADPTKTDHKLGGWYKDASFTTQWNFSADVVTEDVTLYAWWINKNDITFKVAFYTDGGSLIDTLTVRENDYVSKPKDPEKAGFAFEKWYSDPGCTTLWSFATDKVTAHVTLYAKWVVRPYLLTFNSEGGTVSQAGKTVFYRERVGALPTPDREGYEFTGWYTGQSGAGLHYADTTVHDTASNLNLYAGWKPKVYTVTFESGGGSSIAPAAVTHNFPAPEPEQPTRAGYDFTGWYSNRELTEPAWSFDGKITRDTTLYAKWAVKSYAIAYRGAEHGADGVSNANPTSYTVEEDIILRAAAKAGYALEGWYDGDSPAANPVLAILRGSTEEKTLHARWQPLAYTLSFDAAGGQVSRPSQPAVFAAAIDSLPTPTRAGHIFGGWFTLPNGGGQPYEAHTPYGVAAGATLHAKWSIAHYRVTLKYNIPGTADGALENVSYSSPIAEPEHFSKQGYEFMGWYDDTSALAPWRFAKGRVTQDTTLWARWRAVAYSVAYHNVEGAAHGNPTSYTVESPNIPLQPASREGYKFASWSSDAQGNTPVTAIPPHSTEEKELWAQWRKIHRVTFAANGGTPAPPDRYIAHGDTVSKPANPGRKGYNFREWFTDSATLQHLWSFTAAPVTQDTTLYAKWEGLPYTLTFGPSGGDIPNNELTRQVTYGTPIGAPPAAVRPGYHLLEWNSQQYGSGKTYTADTPYDTTASITIHARWEANRYAVTFADGAAVVKRDTVTHPATATLPSPDPQRDGYRFVGWVTDADNPAAPLWEVGNPVTQDVTLYVRWETKTYSVAFESNGGSEVKDTTVAHNGKIRKPADPAKPGFAFGGWYADEEPYEHPWDFATHTVTAPTTLYARWWQTGHTGYLLVLDAAGGAVSPAYHEVEYLKKVGALPEPRKAGHTFGGWFSAADGAGKSYGADTVFDREQNTTLYAKWDTIAYTVTLNATGGTLAGAASITSYYGQPLGLMPAARKDGHSFDCWSTTASGTGITYAPYSLFDQLLLNLADAQNRVELHARWSINRYRVTFDSRGGASVPTQEVLYGGTVSEGNTDATRLGYRLNGWYSSSAKWDFSSGTVTQDTTLYAAWKPDTFTITYNTNGSGASLGLNPPSVQAPFGEPLGGRLYTAAEVSQTGFRFAGWNAAQNGLGAWYTDTTTYSTVGATTLYAQWDTLRYAVRFEPNGADHTPADTLVKHGGKVAEPAKPTKTGYEFVRWCASKELAAPWSFSSSTVTQDTTLYAEWRTVSYSVTFERNDGSAVSSTPAPHGSLVAKPADPIKDGFAFGGWYADNGYEHPWDFAASRVTDNVTLYARWWQAKDTYLLLFNANGGAVDTLSKPVRYRSKVGVLPTPTRKGYAFVEWNRSPSGNGQTYVDTTTYAVEESVILFAGWSVIAYNITYNDLTAGDTHANPPTYTVENEVALLNAARDGGKFNGWYTAATEGSRVSLIPAGDTGNVTLWARWKPGYTVSFFDGGSEVTELRQAVMEGDTVAKPPLTERENYAFGGWYKEPDCNNPWDFSGTVVTDNVNLYAKWWLINSNVYTLIFDAGEGSLPSVTKEVTYQQPVGDLPTPAREGYHFDGWYTRSGDAETRYTEETTYSTRSNTILYAKWTVNTYTVTFTASGSQLAPQQVSYGDTVRKPAPDPSKAGYRFTGWYADESCTYAWRFSEHRVTQPLQLYAGWTPEEYRITYQLDGGLNSAANPVSYSIASGTVNLQPASKSGFEFTGWYSAQAGGSIVAAIPPSGARDTTLWARWVKVHTVNFNANGGWPIPQSLTVADGSHVSEPNPAPARSGYALEGWYSDRALATRWSFNSAVTADATLHARWSFNEYAVTFNANGGAFADGGSTAARTVKHDHTICSPPENPTKSGAVFDGWYRDAALTARWDFCAEVTGSMTLQAGWKSPTSVRLQGVRVNGVEQEVKGDTIAYAVPCDSLLTALRVQLDLPEGVSSSFPQDTVLEIHRASRRSLPVLLSAQGVPAKRYTILLEKPFAFDSIVHVQLGGRLLMVIKNPDNNGNYHLQNAWWQPKIGDSWGRVGPSFYYVPPLGKPIADSIRVVLKDTAGASIPTCYYDPSAKIAPADQKIARVAAYPNPVPAGGTVYLRAENPAKGALESTFSTVAIFDVQGRRCYAGKISDLQRGVTMPNTPGTYFILLEGGSQTAEIKVSVGQ
jgi:uncharacterized repeat protein (TIGR02543 family)